MKPRIKPWRSRFFLLGSLALLFASGFYASGIATGGAATSLGKPPKPTHPTDTGETGTTTETTATTATSTEPTQTITTSTGTTETTGTTATTATTGTTATTSGTTEKSPSTETSVAATTETTASVPPPAATTTAAAEPVPRAPAASSLSSSATASAKLLSPKNGSQITRPPVLRWLRIRGASYYNVQVYRGTQKILSAWPSKNSYALTRIWSYKRHRFVLTRGRYTWFVWPGIGPRSAARYGKMLGRSSFAVSSG